MHKISYQARWSAD